MLRWQSPSGFQDYLMHRGPATEASRCNCNDLGHSRNACPTSVQHQRPKMPAPAAVQQCRARSARSLPVVGLGYESCRRRCSPRVRNPKPSRAKANVAATVLVVPVNASSGASDSARTSDSGAAAVLVPAVGFGNTHAPTSALAGAFTISGYGNLGAQRETLSASLSSQSTSLAKPSQSLSTYTKLNSQSPISLDDS